MLEWRSLTSGEDDTPCHINVLFADDARMRCPELLETRLTCLACHSVLARDRDEGDRLRVAHFAQSEIATDIAHGHETKAKASCQVPYVAHALGARGVFHRLDDLGARASHFVGLLRRRPEGGDLIETRRVVQ